MVNGAVASQTMPLHASVLEFTTSEDREALQQCLEKVRNTGSAVDISSAELRATKAHRTG